MTDHGIRHVAHSATQLCTRDKRALSRASLQGKVSIRPVLPLPVAHYCIQTQSEAQKRPRDSDLQVTADATFGRQAAKLGLRTLAR